MNTGLSYNDEQALKYSNLEDNSSICDSCGRVYLLQGESKEVDLCPSCESECTFNPLEHDQTK